MLLLDAASFTLVALITRTLLPETTRHPANADRREGLRPDWRFLRDQPALRAITLLTAATNGIPTACGCWVRPPTPARFTPPPARR
ncbi:hypothetical protein [Saccharopolyspora griseoalba]|uniref:Uncharacterized protein n=1 Tax=Saccharopolyspora griseoalba TaxID=1431848 RepID=A0ABW2LCT5_9PSEU